MNDLFHKERLIKSTAENTYLYPALLAFLIVTKEYNYENYNDYINKGDTPEKLISDLYAMVPNPGLIDSHSCVLIESFLIGSKKENGNIGDALKRHENIKNNANASKEQKNYSTEVIRISNSFGVFNPIVLDSLKKRIDMLENFKFSS